MNAHTFGLGMPSARQVRGT